MKSIEKSWVTKAGHSAEINIVCLNDNAPHHRCGYIAITENVDLSDIIVHGGITFNEIVGGLHLIGFDCAHFCDGVISARAIGFNPSKAAKSLEFCVKECESLSMQIAVKKQIEYNG